MTINYDNISENYDNSRNANLDIIKRFDKEIGLKGKTILDFGCGTGNFTCALMNYEDVSIYGVEPSEGMRKKALEKKIVVKKGNHKNIPFEDNYFDFIYMTDVIHHVPDIQLMFKEFYRILKPKSYICILTESHQQLENRFFVKYFPSIVDVEKNRYPDIDEIVKKANNSGLKKYKLINTDKENNTMITLEFISLVENKGYSMFELIQESEHKNGLQKLKNDLKNKITINNSHGETLIWLTK